MMILRMAFGAMAFVLCMCAGFSGGHLLNQATAETPAYKGIKLSELFPEIAGNIRDYTVVIPTHFQSDFSHGDGSAGYLWGTSEDLKNWQDNSAIKEGILRSRFSRNVGLGEDGKITASDRASIEKFGLKNLVIKSGNFKGIKGVPVVWFSGDLKGNPIYMLYIYSPKDNLVVLVNLQGAKKTAQSAHLWKTFTDSFEIK